MEKCGRCHKDTNGCTIMSMFDTQIICMDCADRESERGDYKDARKADENAIKNGNYNFNGIGY